MVSCQSAYSILRIMTTNKAFEAILDSIAPKKSRSRLEPYFELIFELHRRGRTYREIVRILKECCGFQTSRSTVNDFVRAHSKTKRNLQRRGSPEAKTTQPPDTASSLKTNFLPTTGGDADEIQKRISDFRRRPVPTETRPQLFCYDPSKPLRITKTNKTQGEQ